MIASQQREATTLKLSKTVAAGETQHPDASTPGLLRHVAKVPRR